MLNIVCKKSVLMDNISIVSKAVAVRSTMPIISCILLIADRNGFRMLANDMELSIESDNMEAEVYDLGTVAVDARILSETIRSFYKDTVTIKSDENNNVLITDGTATFNIKSLPGDQFPMPADIDKNEAHITINAVLFKNMIKKTIFSAATEDSRPILKGELIKIENGVINVVAIDGFRVAWQREKTTADINFSIVVPAKALTEVSRLLSDDENAVTDIYFTENQALFEIKGCKIVTRLLEGEFLNYENLFSCDSTTEMLINRDTLLKSLSKTVIVAKDSKNSKVDMNMKNNTLTINANDEYGNVHEEIPTEISGDDLAISFNARYLMDILGAIDETTVSFNFMTEKSPCIVRSTTGKEYKYLVLPLLNFR